MNKARELAKKGAAEGTVVIADKQTAGRGRLGRTWLSPEGSLAMSVILKPSLNNLPQLVMIASLAVVRSISKVTGLETRIKWPNDVLIKGKKVCGILIESEVKGGIVNFSIIGIGINVNFNPLAFPEISDIATTLSHDTATEISKTELISALLFELEQLYLEAQAGVPIYREWQEKMETLGKWVQVRTGNTVEQGKAETVTEYGNLILRRADGSLAEIVAGDVTVIKD
jgi:BirA family biotin operon repressor/biotin-[acetyl-CoA-carboxylase] ligase